MTDYVLATEARKMICPLSVRGSDCDEDVYATCKGPSCMAWRRKDDKSGFCGLVSFPPDASEAF